MLARQRRLHQHLVSASPLSSAAAAALLSTRSSIHTPLSARRCHADIHTASTAATENVAHSHLLRRNTEFTLFRVFLDDFYSEFRQLDSFKFFCELESLLQAPAEGVSAAQQPVGAEKSAQKTATNAKYNDSLLNELYCMGFNVDLAKKVALKEKNLTL